MQAAVRPLIYPPIYQPQAELWLSVPAAGCCWLLLAGDNLIVDTLHTHTQFYSSTGGRMWARQHLGSGSGVKTEAALCVDIVAIYYLQVV